MHYARLQAGEGNIYRVRCDTFLTLVLLPVL
jgi:hypothetical protein